MRLPVGDYVVGCILLTHHYVEPFLAVPNNPVHLFVLRGGNVREVDVNQFPDRVGLGT